VIDEASRTAAAVDPVEPDKLFAAAEREGVEIKAVLCTHSHADHSAGNAEMARRVDGLRVYGGEREARPGRHRAPLDRASGRRPPRLIAVPLTPQTTASLP